MPTTQEIAAAEQLAAQARERGVPTLEAATKQWMGAFASDPGVLLLAEPGFGELDQGELAWLHFAASTAAAWAERQLG